MTDTPPEIAELVRQKLMARSGEERFLMGVRMFDAARAMGLKQSAPQECQTRSGGMPAPMELRPCSQAP
jgi:hypothetical protein